ncbi:hypothetical protein MNBD_GAMMA10-2990 [hydrothermal vent metagenome]|uniref:HTH cro/C1-type domain-containing protein n=1 Tax=hydrothermal vent metagenome TaxID=652676 RepID=A0A3B0YHS7_9ZZZZ
MSAKDMFYSEGKEFSRAEKRVYAREELVYNVTEDILIALEDLDVSKKELARRLGKSRSFVTQMLSGARNMTLGSLSDICGALGVKPAVSLTIERAEAKEDFLWVNENIAVKENRGDLIQQSENVFDCCNLPEWEKVQTAA